jgi:hypothetical protein
MLYLLGVDGALHPLHLRRYESEPRTLRGCIPTALARALRGASDVSVISHWRKRTLPREGVCAKNGFSSSAKSRPIK